MKITTTLAMGIIAASSLSAGRVAASDAIRPYVARGESGPFRYAVFNHRWLRVEAQPDRDEHVARVAIVGFTREPGRDVVIPASLEGMEVYGIDEEAFRSVTGIRSVTLPRTVRFLRAGTLNRCEGLENIFVAEDHPEFAGVDGVLFDRRKTTLLAVGAGRNGHFRVPDHTTAIGPYAFAFCTKLTRITLPDGVTDIGGRRGGVFMGCSRLERIDIPDTVTNIGQRSFQDCTSLRHVTVPPGITAIPHGLFWRCRNLAGVTLPEGIVSIGNYAFAECRELTLRALPASLTTIGAYAFLNCAGLEGLTVPERVTRIGRGAFSGTGVILANRPEAGSGE